MGETTTLSGTIVSISSGVPASYNLGGFEALTFTEIGEIVSPPSGGGRTYEDVNYNLLKDRATVHLKGTYDEAETTFEIVTKRSDSGQVILLAAHRSDNYYSFKVQYPDGDIDYYQARVYGVVDDQGDANAVRRKSVTIRKHPMGMVEVAGPGVSSFTLTYTAGSNGSIIGISPQVVNISGNGSAVAAAPDNNYVFDQWSDGDTSNPRQDIYIQADITVTANFVLA